MTPTRPRTAGTPRRPTPVHAGLLNVLFAISLLGVGLTSLALADNDAPTAHARAVAGAICVVLLAGLWWWRLRRGPSLGVTVALAVVALAASYAGDNILAMLPVFCVILVLALDSGPTASIVFAVALVVLQSVTFPLLTDHDLAYILTQTVAVAAILAFVVALALLLHASAVDSAVRQGLLAERDAANTDLQQANTRLRRSIESEKELVLAQERARSARELHDGLGHRLTVITMSLDFAQRMRGTDPDRAWAEVATARDTTTEAMAEMRLWVRALNPVSVEGLQGAAALDAVADAFRGTGVDVRLEVTGTERPLPDEVLLFSHRFVQEGLTNALRHARARAVRIGLDYRPEALGLSLVDDGAAGRPAGVTPGFGLRSLAERAADLGGEFDARPGEAGFVLTATIPLADAGAPPASTAAPEGPRPAERGQPARHRTLDESRRGDEDVPPAVEVVA